MTAALRDLLAPHVFHRAGEPIRGFHRNWKTACRQAGVLGMILHDFRRTAIRNLVRAGIVERVAMTLTGHKTRSVLERYNIVSEGDLSGAARPLDAAVTNAAGIVPGMVARKMSRTDRSTTSK